MKKLYIFFIKFDSLLPCCLCDELITRPEESYRLWCVVVCDLKNLIMRPWPTGGCRAKNKQTNKQTLPCSHEPATEPYPEPDKSSPHAPYSTSERSILALAFYMSLAF